MGDTGQRMSLVEPYGFGPLFTVFVARPSSYRSVKLTCARTISLSFESNVRRRALFVARSSPHVRISSKRGLKGLTRLIG